VYKRYINYDFKSLIKKISMQAKISLTCICLLFAYISISQNRVVISDENESTPHPSSVLELISGDKGFLLPRMETEQRSSINDPAEALLIFNKEINCFEIYVESEWHEVWCHGDEPEESFECGEDYNYDGYDYATVKIGDQCWFAENLNVGTRIDSRDASNNPVHQGTSCEDIEKYCQDEDETNCDFYGGLYQWNQAMCGETTEGAQGICPDGWRIPSDDDWKVLEIYAGMDPDEADEEDWRGTDEGAKLKSCRQVNSPLGGECATDDHPRWNSSGSHWGLDEFGFAVLPGGMRHSNGALITLGGSADFWTSTESGNTTYDRTFFNINSDINRKSNNNKSFGYSVRCLKNN